MSLAFVKNLFFRTPGIPPSAGERQHLLNRGPPSTDTVVGDDVEDLNFKGCSANGRSRIDPRIISDATIGLSDGLTVPFALTAGLSALGDTRVVIYGGFAELIAGALSMGLGGYLGAKSEM